MKEDRLLIRGLIKDGSNSSRSEVELILIKHKKTKNIAQLTVDLRRFITKIKQHYKQSLDTQFIQARGCSSNRYIPESKLPAGKEKSEKMQHQYEHGKQQQNQLSVCHDENDNPFKLCHRQSAVNTNQATDNVSQKQQGSNQAQNYKIVKQWEQPTKPAILQKQRNIPPRLSTLPTEQILQARQQEQYSIQNQKQYEDQKRLSHSRNRQNEDQLEYHTFTVQDEQCEEPNRRSSYLLTQQSQDLTQEQKNYYLEEFEKKSQRTEWYQEHQKSEKNDCKSVYGKYENKEFFQQEVEEKNRGDTRELSHRQRTQNQEGEIRQNDDDHNCKDVIDASEAKKNTEELQMNALEGVVTSQREERKYAEELKQEEQQGKEFERLMEQKIGIKGCNDIIERSQDYDKESQGNMFEQFQKNDSIQMPNIDEYRQLNVGNSIIHNHSTQSISQWDNVTYQGKCCIADYLRTHSENTQNYHQQNQFSKTSSRNSIKRIKALSRSSSNLSSFQHYHNNDSTSLNSYRISSNSIPDGISHTLASGYLANGFQCKFTESIASNYYPVLSSGTITISDKNCNPPTYTGSHFQRDIPSMENNLKICQDQNKFLNNQSSPSPAPFFQRKAVPSLVGSIFSKSVQQNVGFPDTKYTCSIINPIGISQNNITISSRGSSSSRSNLNNTKLPAELTNQSLKRMTSSHTDLKLKYSDLFTSPELMLKCQVYPSENVPDLQCFERPRTLSRSVSFSDSSKQSNNLKSALLRRQFQQDNPVNCSSISVSSMICQTLRQPQFMISAKLAMTVLEIGLQLVEKFSLFNSTAQEIFEIIFKTDIHVDRILFSERIAQHYPQLVQSDFDTFFEYLDVNEENILSVNSTGAALMQICNYKSPESGKLIKVFNFLDAEKKGFVTKLEIEMLLHPLILQKNYHNSAVNLSTKLIAEADWDQKGFVTYWEIFSRKHSEPVKQLVEIITA